jgi:2-(1,2-epoxy-1,2-dihydrophenyl)acetyl-CoA isomerase
VNGARDLVERVYAALRAGDKDTLRAVLAPDFVGTIADGMPVAAGTHRGVESAIDDGWWTIGRSYAVFAEPDEYVDTVDGRLLVLGRYRGTARADGHAVDAAFAHVWTWDGERLTNIIQITDTARW